MVSIRSFAGRGGMCLLRGCFGELSGYQCAVRDTFGKFAGFGQDILQQGKGIRFKD